MASTSARAESKRSSSETALSQQGVEVAEALRECQNENQALKEAVVDLKSENAKLKNETVELKDLVSKLRRELETQNEGKSTQPFTVVFQDEGFAQR